MLSVERLIFTRLLKGERKLSRIVILFQDFEPKTDSAQIMIWGVARIAAQESEVMQEHQ